VALVRPLLYDSLLVAALVLTYLLEENFFTGCPPNI
jgi:hypothetical protein